MQSVCEGKEFDFPAEELKTLSFWDDTDAFKYGAAKQCRTCYITPPPYCVARSWFTLTPTPLACREQLRRTEGKREFVFYDGPPFATGLPHYGHILAGSIKVSSAAPGSGTRP
jgi:isoleucyl-tRNA synthetase